MSSNEEDFAIKLVHTLEIKNPLNLNDTDAVGST